MVKRKFISDVLSVDFLSRLFGNQGTILARQSLFDGKIIIFNLLFVTIIIKYLVHTPVHTLLYLPSDFVKN